MTENTAYMKALTDEEQRRRALQAQQDLARQQSGLTKAGITTLPGKPGDPWEGLTTLPGSPGDSLEKNLTLYNAPQNSYQRALSQATQTAVPQTTQTATQKQAGAVQIAANDPAALLAANEARRAQIAAQTSAQNPSMSDTIYNTGKTVISPENYQSYRMYRRKDDSFTGNMGAADRAAWNAIGAKYAAGDKSWLTDTNDFREDGNWSSYYDDNGNINGWLYAANGVGNYAPVFGGKVGETGYKPGTVFFAPDDTAYILDRDGTLVRSGNVTWGKYGEYTGPIDAGLHGTFKSSNGNTYDYETASDDVLHSHGYFRGADGLVRTATAEELLRYAVQSGNLTPEQAALRYASYRQGETGGYPSGGSTPNGGNIYSSYLNNYDYNGGNYGNYAPSDYKSRRDAATSRAENMEWNYDPNTDPVWQAYQKQYRREGDRATNEAMAQAAAMTGGIPSSYAATAASQAGDYYAAQLSDRLPQVYQDSYNRYLNEFQRQLQLADQWAGYDDREYSRDYQARRDAISDARYDQEWAQKLREYADEQSWKAKDWEQYLREYGDQLSEKEREWAYQMARDAIDDARYEQDWAQKLREYDDEQSWKTQDWAQKLREYDDEQAQLGLENDWAQTKFNIALQEYDDGRYYDALDIFRSMGVAGGRVADILDIPVGTTWDQYLAQLGYDPLSAEASASSSYTGAPTPGGNTSKTPKAENETKPVAEASKENSTQTSYKIIPGVYHDGTNQPMTEGFRDNWKMFRDAYDQGATESEIIRAIDTLIAQGKIADYEKDVILRKLGLKSGLNTTWRSR